MTIRNRPASPALRIAVVGVGGVGSAFAFQLAREGGHAVTAIARPASLRLEQLQRDGGVIDQQGERADVVVADALDERVPYDLVVVTLLAHQVAAVLPALQRSSAKAMLFMFNNFEPERLRDAVGAERCSFGMPFIQASLDRQGRLAAKIGSVGQKSKIDSRRWVDVFKAAGLPATVEENMMLWLRCHAPLGAAFESVSVAAVRRRGGASWQEALTIARGALETFTLIQRLGYRIYPSGKAFLHAGPAQVLAGVLWSMSRIPSFRSLLATGENECRALVDTFVSNALRAGPQISAEKIAAMAPAQL